MSRMRVSLVLCGVFVLTVGVVAASAGNGGNSANAKLCQKGGWTSLLRSDGSSFADQGECVSYGAQGNTPLPKSKSQLDCESFGGTFSTDPTTDQIGLGDRYGDVVWTCNDATTNLTVPNANIALFTADCQSYPDGKFFVGHVVVPYNGTCYAGIDEL